MYHPPRNGDTTMYLISPSRNPLYFLSLGLLDVNTSSVQTKDSVSEKIIFKNMCKCVKIISYSRLVRQKPEKKIHREYEAFTFRHKLIKIYIYSHKTHIMFCCHEAKEPFVSKPNIVRVKMECALVLLPIPELAWGACKSLQFIIQKLFTKFKLQNASRYNMLA